MKSGGIDKRLCMKCVNGVREDEFALLFEFWEIDGIEEERRNSSLFLDSLDDNLPVQRGI